MNSVAARRENQPSGFIHYRSHRVLGWRIEHNVCQHHRLSSRIAGKIDLCCASNDATSAIGPDDVSRANAKRCRIGRAPDDNLIHMRLYRLDKMASPNVHAEFHGVVFEKPLGGSLRQE